MSNVFANGRLVLHQGDGLTHVAAPPDVCKVPTPAGPVPTPFVNTAQDAMLAKGSKQTSIAGNPVALASSELSTSAGDEPGTAGGVISSKIKGKLTWGGSSMDVKVEGKGVARFLDPTLQNGNTFNTAFISNGQTGLAYGDDAACGVCDKPVDSHRVHETGEVVATLLDLFKELRDRFLVQEERLRRYLDLLEQRRAERAVFELKIDKESANLEELEQGVASAKANLDKASKEHKAKLGSDYNDAKKKAMAKENEIKAIRRDMDVATQAFTQELRAINDELGAMRPVLGASEGTGTYTKPYMIGACICKCVQNPKRLAAASGEVTPGFRDAVDATGTFALVDGFTQSERQKSALETMNRNVWDCAAPKLLQAGGAGGHKVKTLSEKWYSPLGKAVKVTYTKTKDGESSRGLEKFQHGESVPSCETCQQLTPEMLCDNQAECP
ncbi:PAAR-like domain-containing protein [Sorangium sp. So ce385]|uniref:PAAR-like domain-containing protein n=1 Tax=Sorangium sp. So ce385 TaxID=3133308 RepID=UPI003F5C45B0